MEEIYIVCDTERIAVYLFKYFCNNVKFDRVHKYERRVYIGNQMYRFVSDDHFYRNLRHGFRGKAMSGSYFGRMLDEYVAQQNKLKDVRHNVTNDQRVGENI